MLKNFSLDSTNKYSVIVDCNIIYTYKIHYSLTRIAVSPIKNVAISPAQGPPEAEEFIADSKVEAVIMKSGFMTTFGG